jgi:phage protein D
MPAEVLPIYRETTPGGEPEPFYVPSFQVKIEGRKLPNDVLNDVTQVTYKDKVDDLDSFEITVNNWDADQLRFKYEPPEKGIGGMFDPGQRIELYIGYVKNLRKMLIGVITTLQPNFPETGAPTLTVTGVNILHGFRKKQHTWSWEGKTDSQIAREIALNPVSDNRPGLGLRSQQLKTPNASEEKPEEFVFMNGQFDIVFLLERARQRGYTVQLELRRDDKEQEQACLIFGRSESVREVTYELEWGKTLASFRPTLQTANQIGKVTVRGWDRRAKRPIEGTAKLPQDGAANLDWQSRVGRAVNDRHEEITNQPVRTSAEAKSLAKKILGDQTRRMITASGVTVGLPDLRAGCKVRILGFGARRVAGRTAKEDRIVKTKDGVFDGEYFITETTHTLNDQGYRTQFTARREKELP